MPAVRGKILAEGTLEELKRLLGDGEVVTIHGSFDAEGAQRAVGELDEVKLLSAEDGRLVLSARGEGAGAVRVLSKVLGSELAVAGVSIQPPSLNGLFLKLTGRELRD